MFTKTLPRMSIFILFVPISIYLSYTKVNPTIVFIISFIALLGLIALMSKSTDQLSITAGPVIGGLLNATFGNFPSLFIGLSAIQKGLHVFIKAQWIGNIIGNILLVVGLAMFIGGLKYKTDKFSRVGTGASLVMLVLVLIVFAVPTYARHFYGLQPESMQASLESALRTITLCGAGLLVVIYILYLIFSLKTHAYVFKSSIDISQKADWSSKISTIILLATSIFIAFESDLFVSSIQGMLEVKNPIFSELFMGVIFAGSVGNVAAAYVGINMAVKNKMDVAFQVSLGAALQVALLVVPFLVFYSFIIGRPITFSFSGLGLLSLGACTIISGFTLIDGESNWFEGIILVSAYIIIAVAYFFQPIP